MPEKLKKLVEQPIKESIDKLEAERKQLRAIADALNPLKLTNKALIAIRDGRVLALPEKSIGQIEELGRTSLSFAERRLTRCHLLDLEELWMQVSAWLTNF